MLASTYQARRRLRKADRPRILIDNSFLAAGRIKSSAWFDTGSGKWGRFDIGTGYAGAMDTYRPGTGKRICEQLPFLLGLAYLAKIGAIELVTSFEMKNESFHQPAGRYSEYSYFDRNIFSGMRLRCVDCDRLDTFDLNVKPQDRIRDWSDEPFRSIVNLIGEKNNVDAWHIHTMDIFELDFFLHMDFSLDEEMRKNRKNAPISRLFEKVVLPETFAANFDILPVDIDIAQ